MSTGKAGRIRARKAVSGDGRRVIELGEHLIAICIVKIRLMMYEFQLFV